MIWNVYRYLIWSRAFGQYPKRVRAALCNSVSNVISLISLYQAWMYEFII